MFLSGIAKVFIRSNAVRKEIHIHWEKSSILTLWAKMGKVTRWKGPIHLQALAPLTTLKLLSVGGRREKGDTLNRIY